MNIILRKVSLFVFMSVLLTSGFNNFMIQEAFAASAYSTAITGALGGDSASTTTIVVTFTNPIYTTNGLQDGSNFNEAARFSVAGNTVNTANIESRLNGAGCAPGTTNVTLVLNTAIATDATPLVSYTTDAAVNACNDDTAVPTSNNNTPTDGLSPVFSSAATASATRIDVTFSEAMADPGATPGDFVIGGGLTNAPVVTAITVSGSDLQLTLSQPIVNGDTPTVAFTNTGTRPTDTAAPSNDLANFGAQAVTNNVAAVVTSTNTGGGSGCDDCEPPTLGIDSNGYRQVTNGFTYNGHSVDVERFFTPYPLIKANVGQLNKAEFKIYENQGPDNISHFSFAFGLAENQIISQSKAMIELDIAFDGTETVTIIDDENVLDKVKVKTSRVSCTDTVQQNCLGVTIDHMFRAPLDFNIVATNVWDSSRGSWQNLYNHGIEVVGESLNPPKEYDGINKGHIYHLTETSKTTAVDEFGNAWSLFNDQWIMDYVPIKKSNDEISMSGIDRDHSNFNAYKYGQYLLAENKLGQLCSACFDESFAELDEIFSYEYPEKIDKLDNPEIQSKMNYEHERAQSILEHIFDPLLYRK